MNRTAVINRFSARANNGKEYVIIEYQKYIDAGAGDHPNDEIPGVKDYRTTTGLQVVYIDSETFKILETDEIVRKV